MRFMQHINAYLVAILVFCATSAHAASTLPSTACAKVQHDHEGFVVCLFNPATADIRLFLRDAKGDAFGGFDRLANEVAASGGVLVFAMNGGMYQLDLSPVGLHVEHGRELHPINRSNGQGNFTLKPNGVFWARPGAAGVSETQKYLSQNNRAEFATQSGPMLVISGRIHPKIHATGTSEKMRNGVGQCEDGMIRFAISDEPVTFYTFATLFRDKLKCPDALFLDGSISALYAPALKRNDGWKPMGPIIGVVEGLKK